MVLTSRQQTLHFLLELSVICHFLLKPSMLTTHHPKNEVQSLSSGTFNPSFLGPLPNIITLICYSWGATHFPEDTLLFPSLNIPSLFPLPQVSSCSPNT
jgi:hypothetical protein